ncbi:cysteine-rich venom protein Cau1-like [Polypterus senegalus]|uniref:cysteine-rich venom protein Cau1-like n=1 Tax=Polypterus senegalus TaxID=55291 RepID=UPI001963BF7F|nr:cysteine-rich venom protein Cau1-like [Polypterus senegalus]XP_039604050.1 cysteine-rich venom protein Cau1-like [Polypterus senegalus]XP_039604051.1 cysteine-rich venom protein Cau1-like [Polypterus senegalus]
MKNRPRTALGFLVSKMKAQSGRAAVEKICSRLQMRDNGKVQFRKAPKNDKLVGHYTQMIWASSGFVGCAGAYYPNSPYKYFYVCHYCPVGNINTDLYTSGAPCSSCPKACEKNLCTHD